MKVLSVSEAAFISSLKVALMLASDLTGDTRWWLRLLGHAAVWVVVGLALWFALRFADRQVEPLTDLVAAAREVGAGNFALRVEGRTGGDEVGLLNRAFNRMTAQLEKQTDALVTAAGMRALALSEPRAFAPDGLDPQLARTEGILPALESSHAIAQAIKLAREMPKDQLVLCNLSGRGDKDVHTIAARDGIEF